MKIAVTGKGGVGKTTFAATLARLYAEEGRHVLAADVDPDAILLSITCSGQTHPAPPVSTVPRTRSFTPLHTFPYASGISSTFGLIL